MTKGKHKHKKQNAQKKAEQAAAYTPAVEDEKMTDNETEAARQGTGKSAKKRNPSWWQRFKEYVCHSSSFTDWCIAAFTLVLAAAAIYQFIIMGGQLDAMRKDQRAWIAVSQKGGTVISFNVAPSTSMNIVNTGKTPATDIVGHFYVEVVPDGETPHFEAQAMHTTMISGVAIPNAPQESHVSRRRYKIGGKSDEAEDDPLTENEMKDLNEGKSWVAVHGIVWYDDVFKTRHWIKFCTHGAIKAGDYISRSCTAYNSIDND